MDKDLEQSELAERQAEAARKAEEIRQNGVLQPELQDEGEPLGQELTELEAELRQEAPPVKIEKKLSEEAEVVTLAAEDAVADAAAENAPVAAEEEETDDGSMSLIRHLTELRLRIIRSLVALAIGSGIAYYYNEPIMQFIMHPAGKLYYMQPAEAFFTSLKVSIFAGFLLAMPFIFYQAWKFLLPALTIREKTIIGLIVPSSVLLFLSGLLFSFYFVLPIAVDFFLGFGTDYLQPMFSIQQYFNFVMTFILPFGMVFELPLVIIILAKLGLVTSEMLRTKQSMVIFCSFIVGAILSPPDIFSQTLLALPMILLYEISYFIVRFVLRK